MQVLSLSSNNAHNSTVSIVVHGIAWQRKMKVLQHWFNQRQRKLELELTDNGEEHV